MVFTFIKIVGLYIYQIIASNKCDSSNNKLDEHSSNKVIDFRYERPVIYNLHTSFSEPFLER